MVSTTGSGPLRLRRQDGVLAAHRRAQPIGTSDKTGTSGKTGTAEPSASPANPGLTDRWFRGLSAAPSSSPSSSTRPGLGSTWRQQPGLCGLCAEPELVRHGTPVNYIT
jgi:hypothetical protein